MRYLLIDTSYETGIVGFFNDENLVHSGAIPLFASQSKGLFPLIIRLSEEAQIQMVDLDGIAVGVGPGSYTGMRVAAAIAKGLAYALHKPLVGVCSMHAFAPVKDGPFAIVIDARISGGYVLKGDCSGGAVKYHAQPQVLTLDRLAEELLTTPTLLTTPGNRIRARLMAHCPDKEWQWEEHEPSVRQLSHSACEAFQQGNGEIDTKLELMYLRLTQAEIEKQK